MEIRDAVESDLPGLLAIYNDVIATSTAVYCLPPGRPSKTERSGGARGSRRAIPCWSPWMTQASWASPLLAIFARWPGYRFTVEHSVHVRADRRGQGVGKELVKALFPRAEALGKHVMIAGVDAANAASIRFHERLGLREGRPTCARWATSSTAGSISFFCSDGSRPGKLASMFASLPPVTRALIIANVVVFLLQQVAQERPCSTCSRSGRVGDPLFQPWQLVTYGFLHEGRLSR